MIRNVLGKAVTESTVLSNLDLKGREATIEELAKVALELKNSLQRDKDEEDALRYVVTLTDRCPKIGNRLTQGWIYNASGRAITLVDSRASGGGLAPHSLYPLRIGNRQWGVFLFHNYEYTSYGAVVYECVDRFRTFRWCVAWKCASESQVYGKIRMDSDWDNEVEWNNVKSVKTFGLSHAEKYGGLLSVISPTPGPHAVFEALLTMAHL